jgi:carbohydrate diacid regulator
MAQNIAMKTAQQIVDTVKDVCGYNINFIRPDGTILASTNPDRIGTYHEIGHQAAQKGILLEVKSDDAFYGTQKGVNLPFSYEGEIVAVIGITGEPEAVRKYAYLAQRITRLILRERELDSRAHTEKERIDYVVQSLIQGRAVAHDFLDELLRQHKMDPEIRYRTVLVKLENRYNPANLSMIDGSILRIFDQTGSVLHTFEYPDTYVLLDAEPSFDKWNFQFRKLADQNQKILKVGVGSDHRLVHQNRSFREAEIALNSLGEHKSYAVYDDLKLEILLGSISKESKERFRSKTIENLDEKERRILKTYFSNECHLKQTAEELFIHVNTLQYQLDKIGRKTSLDPRAFEDAVALYLGLKV